MSKPIKLAEKASDLIRDALADLKLCEASDDYVINMGHWHEPNNQGQCMVCLAGSVLAQTFESDKNMPLVSAPGGEFSEFNETRIYALNAFREGSVYWGLYHMGYRVSGMVDEEFRVDVYDAKDPSLFHSQLNDLADYLEAEGY